MARENLQDGKTLWALQDVSSDTQRGEMLGNIGRNGAGKSTLLKILSHVTAPTHGHIKIKSRKSSLLEVGIGLHPDLSGRENVFLSGAILGMTRQEIARKFDEIVAFAEIEPFIDTPVKRYSSGMYVRLAFAVGAHLDAEILVIDEILSVGDYAFQEKCLGKVYDVAHSGRTVLFVSHNLEAIRSLCERSILLEHGHLTQRVQTGEVGGFHMGEGGGWGRGRIADSCLRYAQPLHGREAGSPRCACGTERDAGCSLVLAGSFRLTWARAGARPALTQSIRSGGSSQQHPVV